MAKGNETAGKELKPTEHAIGMAHWYGQLGDATTTDSNKPVTVKDLGRFRDIAAGGGHSLALRDDCTVWAWGYNEYGELGDGTFTDSQSPVQVQDLYDVKAISTTFAHSLALKGDGTVWAWGWNGVGQLGNGTFTYDTPNPTPVPVRTDDPLAEDPRQPLSGVAAGAAHSLALKDDGTVRSWGGNWVGQLGDATDVAKSNTPGKVLYLSGITAIDADSVHSLSLNENGLVAAWGSNDSGQLGYGTNAYRSYPAEVEDLKHVKAIDAGLSHNLAVVGKPPVKGQDSGIPDEEPRNPFPNCIEVCE